MIFALGHDTVLYLRGKVAEKRLSFLWLLCYKS